MTNTKTAAKQTKRGYIPEGTTCVIMAGPFSTGPQGFNGVEGCEYVVSYADDNGNTLGNVYRSRSLYKVEALAWTLAENAGVEMVDDTFPE